MSLSMVFHLIGFLLTIHAVLGQRQLVVTTYGDQACTLAFSSNTTYNLGSCQTNIISSDQYFLTSSSDLVTVHYGDKNCQSIVTYSIQPMGVFVGKCVIVNTGLYATYQMAQIYGTGPIPTFNAPNNVYTTTSFNNISYGSGGSLTAPPCVGSLSSPGYGSGVAFQISNILLDQCNPVTNSKTLNKVVTNEVLVGYVKYACSQDGTIVYGSLYSLSDSTCQNQAELVYKSTNPNTCIASGSGSSFSSCPTGVSNGQKNNIPGGNGVQVYFNPTCTADLQTTYSAYAVNTCVQIPGQSVTNPTNSYYFTCDAQTGKAVYNVYTDGTCTVLDPFQSYNNTNNVGGCVPVPLKHSGSVQSYVKFSCGSAANVPSGGGASGGNNNNNNNNVGAAMRISISFLPIATLLITFLGYLAF